MKYYKVLQDGKSCHGGTMKWPLPTADGPGEWVEYDGPLVPCSTGLHVTTEPARWFDASGRSVYAVEIEGEIKPCDTPDKLVCRKVRLVKMLTKTELAEVCVFQSGNHEVKSKHCVLRGNSTAKLWENSTATLRENSTAVNYSGQSKIEVHHPQEGSGQVSCPTCSHAMECLYTNDGESAFWCPRCGTVKSPWLTSPEGERPQLVERCRSFTRALVREGDDQPTLNGLLREWVNIEIPQCLAPTTNPLPPEV